MIKVLLADDQELFREGIKNMIIRDPEIEVVGCANNGNEAMDMCDRFGPDLILMDIRMPDCDGIEATRKIKAKQEKVKIVVLTTYEDVEFILQAMEAGADGYLLKDSKPEDLILAIKGTVSGLRIIHQNVYQTTVKQFTSGIKMVDQNLTRNLSERELELIRLITIGSTNKEIASIMHLSEGRIKTLISEIFRKLELSDRVQLSIFAVKNNLV